MMVKTTEIGNFDDLTFVARLNIPALRSIHSKTQVSSPAMVIVEVARENSFQVALVENDRVVQTIAADTSDDPFHVRILMTSLMRRLCTRRQKRSP